MSKKRPVVAFYEVEEEIFNTPKQRRALDPAGDDSEPDSKEEGDVLNKNSSIINLGSSTLPDTCPDLELDGEADLGSTLLRGMLSEKKLNGFSNGYEVPKQPDIAGEADNKAPTDDDWKNL